MNSKLITFTKKWEGGLSRDTSDSASDFPCPTPFAGKTGWHTNKGVTYKAWTAHFGTQNDDRFFEMNDEDWALVAMSGYWRAMRCDEVAEPINIVLFAWSWGSGKVGATKLLQKILGVTADGVFGNQTMKALNEYIGTYGRKEAFNKLCDARANFYNQIAVGKNEKFLKGWLNRLDDFRKTFKP